MARLPIRSDRLSATSRPIASSTIGKSTTKKPTTKSTTKNPTANKPTTKPATKVPAAKESTILPIANKPAKVSAIIPPAILAYELAIPIKRFRGMALASKVGIKVLCRHFSRDQIRALFKSGLSDGINPINEEERDKFTSDITKVGNDLERFLDIPASIFIPQIPRTGVSTKSSKQPDTLGNITADNRIDENNNLKRASEFTDNSFRSQKRPKLHNNLGDRDHLLTPAEDRATSDSHLNTDIQVNGANVPNPSVKLDTNFGVDKGNHLESSANIDSHTQVDEEEDTSDELYHRIEDWEAHFVVR